MDKVRSLLGHAASLPWLLFIWSAAEILERVEFIAQKMHDAREFIMTPGGAVFLLAISVLWLTAIVFWPNIKTFFPSLPESLHARVHKLTKEYSASCTKIEVL